MNTPVFLAAIVTAVVYFFLSRFTKFVQTDFNTQAYVDPNSVPGAVPSEADARSQYANDAITTAATPGVMIPMAQLASGYGEELTPNPLNPVLPPMQYGNLGLDMPTLMYIPHASPSQR